VLAQLALGKQQGVVMHLKEPPNVQALVDRETPGGAGSYLLNEIALFEKKEINNGPNNN
jgi:hypothetical protein